MELTAAYCFLLQERNPPPIRVRATSTDSRILSLTTPAAVPLSVPVRDLGSVPFAARMEVVADACERAMQRPSHARCNAKREAFDWTTGDG